MSEQNQSDHRGEKGEILLEMKDVRIDGFSDERWHKIIKGVDLTLRRGEVLGLIGESGAGKSTLGKAAMGYAQPGCRILSGSIMFDGIDLMAATDVEKRALWGSRIAYVAQSAAASFNPAHRLIAQTVEATVGHGVALDEAARGDAVDRPDLIIFDEPTTALDVTTQVDVLLSMRSIVEKFHTAAIYITHDLAVVAQMADRIKVLRYGEEVEEAETQQMLSHPTKDYTKSLWSVRALQKPEIASEDIVLSVKNVDAAYARSIKVLDDISIPPMKGTIEFNGEALPPALKDRSKDQLQRIQMIYQMADTAMNPKQTVGEIIGRPLEFYHGLKGAARAARVSELLKMIELDDSFAERWIRLCRKAFSSCCFVCKKS